MLALKLAISLATKGQENVITYFLLWTVCGFSFTLYHRYSGSEKMDFSLSFFLQ